MSKGQTKRIRRRKPGTTDDLRRALWTAVRDVETIIYDEDASIDDRLRAVHALAALSGQYLKATEAAELVERIESLEAAAHHEHRRP